MITRWNLLRFVIAGGSWSLINATASHNRINMHTYAFYSMHIVGQNPASMEEATRFVLFAFLKKQDPLGTTKTWNTRNSRNNNSQGVLQAHVTQKALYHHDFITMLVSIVIFVAKHLLQQVKKDIQSCVLARCISLSFWDPKVCTAKDVLYMYLH